MRKIILIGLLAASFLPLASRADAHTLSNSYLSVVVQGKEIAGQWDIAVRDLEYALGIDANEDGTVTWGELRAQRGQIESLALSSVVLKLGDETCAIHVDRFLLDTHSDGAYAVLAFSAKPATDVAKNAPLSVRYNLLFDVDPQHRGLLNLRYKQDTELMPTSGFGTSNSLIQAMLAGEKASAIFSPDHREQTFSRELPGAMEQIKQFFRNGVWHIWSGYDHILFLVVLLLPAVLTSRQGRWEPVDGFWPIFKRTVKIVTAFSLAHSITLTLAAVGVVQLPSRLVESAIAASIVWGAVNNFYPRGQSRTWLIAFGFGLMHGFGFASALTEFGLSRGTLLRALVSFNLGVEVGQLAIVMAFLPVAYSLRKTQFYRRSFLRAGSWIIGILGFLWLIERAFNVGIIS